MSKRKKADENRRLTMSTGFELAAEVFREHYPKEVFTSEQREWICSTASVEDREHYFYCFGFHTNNMEVFDVMHIRQNRATGETVAVMSVPVEEIPFRRIRAFRRFYDSLPAEEKCLDDGNFDEERILKFMESSNT